MQMLPRLLGAMIQCFDGKVIEPYQKRMNGGDAVEMDELHGPMTWDQTSRVQSTITSYHDNIYMVSLRSTTTSTWIYR
ncbi:hypothetical protein ACE6H2_019549 [Prunus campanulata]